ncbi:MAG TPA: GAF domain-containing sensor histidine kinase [Roseiflexaceae bacterium]|nr:GAF domain-containing sensor histidine kinase [Roseiflexaceae bacterium]
MDIAATSPTPPRPATARDSRRMLGGDRFYAAARWAAVLLLLAISALVSQQPVWPPLASGHPFALLAWAYALFSLLVTVALFIHALRPVLSVAFVVDIAFITLYTYFNRDPRDLFYPLYLLPLVSAAFRLQPPRSLLTGLVTAVAYCAAWLLARVGPANGALPDDPVGLVSLLMKGAGLVFVPWITGGLAERWSTSNRMSVALAEQQRLDALAEANAYRDQMRALYEVAYTLSTTANYQNVLNVALAECHKLVPHTCSLVLLSTGEPDTLFVAASYNLSEQDRAQRLTVGKGVVGQALRAADPCIVADISLEPELLPIAALTGCRAACLVPLRSGLNTYGVMIVASDRAGAFNEEQLGKLVALASYALVALQNAQLIYDLRQEREKLLSKEEEVRHQLARDLHDGPAQALAAITMNVEFIKRLLERDPARVLPELDKLGALAKRTTHEVRTMLFELRPLALETQGLDVTLAQYLERFQGNGTQIILEVENVSAHLDTKTEGTLFNIIQESINNALKHARAEHIWVRLRQTESALETVVQDDGRGFDLAKVKASYEKRGSFGLLNIEERATLVGGLAELHSAPGQGTTVRVIVPL